MHNNHTINLCVMTSPTRFTIEPCSSLAEANLLFDLVRHTKPKAQVHIDSGGVIVRRHVPAIAKGVKR